MKSGPSAGTFVPLASIVVTDQSGVEMKVVLWRRAAFWALTVSPGDVLLITGTEIQLSRLASVIKHGVKVLVGLSESLVMMLELGQLSLSVTVT